MPPLEPTERELEALKVLWDRREATVREVCDALNASPDASAPNTTAQPLAYTTVLSLLQVMEQKGLVTHHQRGKAYVYAASLQRDRTFRQLAAGFLDRVFDGAVDEYLVHALQSRKLTATELDDLGAMIADARQNANRNAKTSKKTNSK